MWSRPDRVENLLGDDGVDILAGVLSNEPRKHPGGQIVVGEVDTGTAFRLGRQQDPGGVEIGQTAGHQCWFEELLRGVTGRHGQGIANRHGFRYWPGVGGAGLRPQIGQSVVVSESSPIHGDADGS